jgi:hypothetical protein
MNTQSKPDAASHTPNSSSPERIPPEHGGEASPDGRNPRPIHPDDIDVDGKPLGDGKTTKHNPLADSPDDAE